jgi:hypothetical protein
MERGSEDAVADTIQEIKTGQRLGKSNLLHTAYGV